VRHASTVSALSDKILLKQLFTINRERGTPWIMFTRAIERSAAPKMARVLLSLR
jgi:hypothetical protein